MDIFNFRFQAEFRDYKGVKPSNPPWMAWITSINNVIVEDTLPLEMVNIAISYDGLLEDFAKSVYLFGVL